MTVAKATQVHAPVEEVPLLLPSQCLSKKTGRHGAQHPAACTVRMCTASCTACTRYKSPGEVRSDRGAYKEETRKIILSLDKIRKVRAMVQSRRAGSALTSALGCVPSAICACSPSPAGHAGRQGAPEEHQPRHVSPLPGLGSWAGETRGFVAGPAQCTAQECTQGHHRPSGNSVPVTLYL